jgi:hypothetical protein
VSRRQGGQASVELIGCAVLLALAAVAVLQVLAVVRTRIAAERVADQAAVLVAEGRPLPQALRARAQIEQRGDRLVVRMPLPFALPPAPDAATVTVAIPR